MLKLSEKLENINKIIENEKTAKNTYKVIISEKNKALILNKSTLEKLNSEGVELEKVYISYNKSPELYNAIHNILVENKDIFRARA